MQPDQTAHRQTEDARQLAASYDKLATKAGEYLDDDQLGQLISCL